MFVGIARTFLFLWLAKTRNIWVPNQILRDTAL